MLNGADIGQKPLKLYTPSIQEPTLTLCTDYYTKVPINHRVECFAGILKLLPPKLEKLTLKKVGSETHFWMSTGITTSNKELGIYVPLSRIRCVKSELSISNNLSHSEASTLENFKEYFSGFSKPFNTFYGRGGNRHTEKHIQNATPIRIWVSGVHKVVFEDYLQDPQDLRKKCINAKDFPEFLGAISLSMDESVLPINNNVLSLHVGSLRTAVEGQDPNNKVSYCLQFLSDDT